MLLKVEGKWQAECDVCHHQLFTDVEDFTTMKQLMFREGWHSLKSNADDDWLHRCGQCYMAMEELRRA